MAYLEDPGLEFLGKMKSADLNDLVECLTKDKDGRTRFTEGLTNSAVYKENHPDHQKYWREIAAEIQLFGANSVVSILRGGKGVLYKEVLGDVADKLGVKFKKTSDVKVTDVEHNILSKVLSDAMGKMPGEDLKKLASEIGVVNYKTLPTQMLIGSVQAIFRAGGFKSYQLTLITANAVMKAIFGRGLALATNAALTRTAALLTGPIGLAITGIWTALDLAGPAYRVTVPAVLQVAALRQKYLSKFEE